MKQFSGNIGKKHNHNSQDRDKHPDDVESGQIFLKIKNGKEKGKHGNSGNNNRHHGRVGVLQTIGFIAISTGRGLIVQAAALLTLAATLGGDAIWFTPVISEAVVLVLSLLLLRNVLKK